MEILNDALFKKKVIAPLVKSWINKFLGKTEFSFTFHTQVWLLPDPLNQGIT